MNQIIKVYRRAIIQLLQGMAVVLATAANTYAQAYGKGVYGSTSYSNGFVQVGPVVLPVTGPQLSSIIAAGCFSIAAGLIVWHYSRRRIS